MLLELKGVSKSFTNAAGLVTRTVLQNLDLSLKEQSSLAIVGPSGSGKTTLLNLIAKLDHPDTGSIHFEDMLLNELSGKSLDAYRNQSIGMVFQLHHLMPQLSLLENVLLPTMPLKVKSKLLLERAEQLLKRVGVWDQRQQKPGELSGGECQRAAVVRALINQPKLLLADEPTGALDEENAKNLANLLLEMHQEQGTTLIMVTHSAELAARMDERLFLKNGILTSSL